MRLETDRAERPVSRASGAGEVRVAGNAVARLYDPFTRPAGDVGSAALGALTLSVADEGSGTRRRPSLDTARYRSMSVAAGIHRYRAVSLDTSRCVQVPNDGNRQRSTCAARIRHLHVASGCKQVQPGAVDGMRRMALLVARHHKESQR